MGEITYDEFKRIVAEDYEQYADERYHFTFTAATGKILDDIVGSIHAPAGDKLMAYAVLALIGLERGELLDEVRAGVLRIIREDRLSKLRDEFSPEDYAAILRDLESITARLGAVQAPSLAAGRGADPSTYTAGEANCHPQKNAKGA